VLSSTTVELLASAGLDEHLVADVVQRALDEDLAYGPDVTSRATVPVDQRVRASFVARKSGTLAGVAVVAASLDVVVGPGRWSVLAAASDGARLEHDEVALEIEAPTQRLLTAERTALNFLCHLSGIATLTAEWVSAVAGTRAKVRDTRKTTPGLRVLDKYAVRCGGGVNHRMGLGDAALIKDNHVAAAGGVAQAVAAVRAAAPNISLEVECDSLAQVRTAVDAQVSLVLLDNMSVDQIAEAVDWVRGKSPSVQLEASGGLTLETVRAVAETDVDYVAVGALTHSAPILDIGLDVMSVLGG
jgi:nicotinate-nucleotide pyrophosphorylase (carboxylating)